MALKKPALGGLCAKLRPMNKLVIGLMVVASFALADEMPEGSEQAAVINAYRDVSAAILIDCVSEVDRPGVEVACLGNLADAFAIMPLFDEAAIEVSGLEPVEAYWQYLEGETRYKRGYQFSNGGTLEAVFAPEDNNQVYVFFTP